MAPRTAVGGHNIHCTLCCYTDCKKSVETANGRNCGYLKWKKTASAWIKPELTVVSMKNVETKCTKSMVLILEWVQKFRYLGTWVASDGRCITEMNRIGQAKTAISKVRNTLCNKSVKNWKIFDSFLSRYGGISA